jgi:hypothetical protein
MSDVMMRCWRCNDKTGGCDNSCMMSGPAWPPAAPKGCVCPPGSEQTCRRWDCGRRDVGARVGSSTYLGQSPAKPTTGE